MTEPDTRWLQRLDNLNRAMSRLGEALERDPATLSDLESEGLIQRFETSLELSWKTSPFPSASTSC